MFLTSILTLFIGIYFLGALAFFSSRNTPYFKYRLPIVTYLMSVHLFIRGIIDIIKVTNTTGLQNTNCLEVYFLNRFAVMPYYILFPFNAYLFTLMYKSHSKFTVSRFTSKVLKLETQKYIIQNYPWYVYLGIYIIALAFPIVIYLIDLASGVLENLSTTYPTNGSTFCTGPSNYSATVVTCLACLFDIYIFYRLRYLNDGYGIQKQYRIMSLVHLPFLILYIIFVSIPIQNILPISLPALFTFLYEFIEILLLFYIPVIYHGKFRHDLAKLKKGIKFSMNDMEQLLQHSSYKRVFLKYASTHLSSNYVLFLDRFNELKKCKSNEVYTVKSVELFQDFLSDKAPYHIKIPKDLKIELLSYKTFPKQVWDSINNYVKEYIYTNLYISFMNHREL